MECLRDMGDTLFEFELWEGRDTLLYRKRLIILKEPSDECTDGLLIEELILEREGGFFFITLLFNYLNCLHMLQNYFGNIRLPWILNH